MDSTTTIEAPEDEAPSTDELCEQIVEMLESSCEPVPRGEIIRRLGRRREVAYRVINHLVADGQVIVKRGPRNRADLVLAQD